MGYNFGDDNFFLENFKVGIPTFTAISSMGKPSLSPDILNLDFELKA